MRKWLHFGKYAAALTVTALVLTAIFSFGPIVRSKIQKRAERLGLVVQVDHVRPLWTGVRLSGVHLAPLQPSTLSAQINQLDVRTNLWGDIQQIRVQGGQVYLSGTPSEIRTQLQTLLAKRGSAPGTSSKSSPPIEASELSIVWNKFQGKEAEPIRISGVSIWKESTLLRFWIGKVTASSLPDSLELNELRLDLTKSQKNWQLTAFQARSGTIRKSAAVPSTSGAPAERNEKGEKVNKIELMQQKIERWQTQIRHLGAAIEPYVKPNMVLSADALMLNLGSGKEQFHLGPQRVSLRFEADRYVLDLHPPHDKKTNAALKLSLKVPKTPGGISLSIDGGPVSLATLGLHEQDLGLFHVRQSTLKASGNLLLSGNKLTFDGQGELHQLSLQNEKLSKLPVEGLNLSFTGKGGLTSDFSEVYLDKGSLEVGGIIAEINGVFRKVEKKDFTFQGKLSVPLGACQGLIDAMPEGLAPILKGMKLAGTFSFNGKLNFDSRKPGNADIDWKLLNDCKVTATSPEVAVSRFQKPFKLYVYNTNRQRVPIQTGPGTPNWIPFAAISRFMEVSVLTTEDGGFPYHQGFSHEAIHNSIRENLKARKFVRGASTISMQTAKNLYLEREKTLSRKLQEAFLTMYLEQSLTKAQIMELYLNIIEFGPMIYGVGAASAHYFHVHPSALTLSQALYMSSILPNPKIQHFGAGGRVTPGWTNYMRRLMRGMEKRRLINEEQLKDALRETAVFGSPEPERLPSVEGPDDSELVNNDSLGRDLNTPLVQFGRNLIL
jgi:hypothetical protein